MFFDHSEPFPRDPNAPRSDRVSPSRLAIEAPARALRTADALERELAQLRLIGPAAGAELRRLVYGDVEQAPARGPARPPRRPAAAG